MFERWNWYSESSSLLSVRYYQGSQKLMKRWQKPGDITDVPRMRYSTSTSGTGSGTTTRFLNDGDFVNYQNMSYLQSGENTLGYGLILYLISYATTIYCMSYQSDELNLEISSYYIPLASLIS